MDLNINMNVVNQCRRKALNTRMMTDDTRSYTQGGTGS